MLPPLIHSLLLFSILLILCFHHIKSDCPDDRSNHDQHINICSDESDDTNFSSDRDKLLNILKTGASNNSSDGFSINSVNAGLSTQITGLMMCYIDIPWECCLSCLNFSTINATTSCPNSRSVTVSYGGCFLRYSHVNFTSQFMPNQKGSTCVPPDRAQNSITWNNTFYTLLESLRAKAIQSTSRYAIGEKLDPGTTNYKRNTIYGVVQCTRDLLPSDCSLCIQSAIDHLSNNCPKYANGSLHGSARVFYIGCYVRYFDYEPHSFTLGTSPIPSFDVSLTPEGSPSGIPLASPPVTEGNSTDKSSKKGFKWLLPIVAGVSVACAVVLILAVGGIWLWRRKTNGTTSITFEGAATSPVQDVQPLNMQENPQFKVFDLDILILATDNFLDKNKLGRGGFGSVYKATLEDGSEIAVKRLDAGHSKQGLPQLKNEVDTLEKAKHRNLVQLVGCCIQEKEMLLCYEFLPNGSLDNFLFANDSTKRDKLKYWKTRYRIIQGITDGLLYLHEKCRVKIIHRDIKPSNILLDIDMTPKISDFGLAKLFEGDQSHNDTSKCGGTFKYRAPEIAHHGRFSTKSDVYSFGVLLLDIVAGKQHVEYSHANSDDSLSLISYVWKHVEEREMDKLKDPVMEDVCIQEVTKCIHIGLLCVQEDPTKRPNMKAVDFMLSDYSTTIPPLPPPPPPLPPPPPPPPPPLKHDYSNIISGSKESNG